MNTELICLARKPLIGTFAENFLEHGVGGLNIDACRIPSNGDHKRPGTVTKQTQVTGDERVGAALGMYAAGSQFTPTNHDGGRWPANIVHDGSDEVISGFPETKSGMSVGRNRDGNLSGSAARFFFNANTDTDEKATDTMGNYQILHGDCLEVMKGMEDNSVHSIVTDPPYGLSFMGKHWDYDVPSVEIWKEAFRVLKPGGHLLAFGGTRTYHRLVVAIEDAGFEIRDMISWIYGQGFPKSLNIGKEIDKKAGAERKVTRERYTVKRIKPGATVVNEGAWGKQDILYTATDSLPATEDAKKWEGWGTALKPAQEPICVARKPLIGTVVENVLMHGTGGLNIDATRISTEELTPRRNNNTASLYKKGFEGKPKIIDPNVLGRFPANVVHDGSDVVVSGFPDAKGAVSNGRKGVRGVNEYGLKAQEQQPGYADDGSAARFFYCAKASAKDRAGSKHPTVKPVKLMEWLVKLVTPKGGIVLDPFAGSGTTGEAAMKCGMNSILIEMDKTYVEDIHERLDGMLRFE